LAEKEDRYDDLAAALQAKEEFLTSLTNEKDKHDKESNSRIASLNQALVQAKQTAAQLTEQVELHQRKQYELAQKLEDLESVGNRESRGTPAKFCRSCRKGTESNTPVKSARFTRSIMTPPTTKEFMSTASEADTLRTENRKLKQDLSCLQTNFELTTQKSFQLRGEVKELESNMLELQNLFDNNLAEKMKLQSRLEEMKEGLKDNKEFQAAGKEKIDELTQQVESLQGELEHMQKENHNLEEKLKSGADLTTERRNMIAKLDSVKQSLTGEKSAMEEEMTSLRAELEKLQDVSQNFMDASSSHQQESKKKTGTINALKSKLSKLSKEKSELTGELANASEKLDQACDKIQLHKDELKAMEIDLRAKDRQIASLSSDRKDQSKLPIEVETLRAKVIETLEEMSELRSKNEGLEGTKKRLDAKISELSKANTKLQRESKHSSELARKMNTELEKTEERVQSLEFDLDAKGKVCDTAQQKLKTIKAELSQMSQAKAGYEDEVKKLVEKIGEAEQQNFELTTKLAERDHQADVVTGKHSNIEQKLAELESKLDAAEFTVLEKESHISDLKCAYELMESENSTLLSQVTSLSEMVSTRNFKLEAHQMHTIRQESDIYEIMEKVSELETEHGGCAKIISDLKEENEGIKATLEKRSSSEMEAERKIALLKIEVGDLEKSVSTLRASNNDLKDEVARLASRNENLSRKCADADSEVHQLEKEIEAEKLTLTAVRDDLTLTKKALKDSEENTAKKIEDLEMKCSDYEMHCTDFARERTELKSHVLELRRELKEQALLSSALQIEKETLGDQFESFKLSALSVVQSEYRDRVRDAAGVSTKEDENLSALSSSRGGKGKYPKKKPRARKVLHPVQDLLD
jgi:chromosome segregation ATPase